MNRQVGVVFALFVAFIAWGMASEYRGGKARAAAQTLQDSIEVLVPQLDSAELRTARAEARVELVEQDYAEDSVVWEAQRVTLAAQAVEDEGLHESIGDSIRARVDEETEAMLDRRDVVFEGLLAGRDSIIAGQTEELSGLRVRIAEWRVLAEERQLGWDTEKLLREQEELRGDVWEAEAERLGNPSLLTRVVSGLPWFAAGYVGSKISP